MHEVLINYINRYSSKTLNGSEIEWIRTAFVPRHLRKREYFLQKGDVCKYSAFILKGAMRQYSVDDKGVEHIVQLTLENWWAGDRESYVMLTPSVYYIDAWEDTDILVITRADLLNLLNDIPAISEMLRILDERNFIATQKRLNAVITLSAEDRYKDLANRYPEFLQRFPQHLIASYLGITKETLSRVRRHTAKNS